MRVSTVRHVPVKGRHVSPEAVRDLDGYPMGKAQLDVWLAARLLAGMHPKAVAVASGGAITWRTAYRWRRALLGLREVELDGYTATFAIRRDFPPSRLTPWTKAA
jgi:hypothetical protein